MGNESEIDHLFEQACRYFEFSQAALLRGDLVAFQRYTGQHRVVAALHKRMTSSATVH